MTSKNKKKHIVHFTSSLKRGGAEGVLHSLVVGLQDTYTQTVLYIHDGPYRKKIEACGVVCIQVKGMLTRYDPYFLYSVYKALQKLKPDGVHTLLWAATIAGRVVGCMLSIPVVTVYHGNLDQDGRVRNFFDRLTVSLSTVNCAVSSGVAGSLREIAPEVTPYVIHNGIDCTQKTRSKKRADIGYSRSSFIVGSVGRLVSIKRFDLLIDTLALLHAEGETIFLCIIGVGQELHSLQERVAQHALQQYVQFLVDVPAVEYYHLFDCFVLPSPREGISMALLEALCAHVPAVVVGNNHPVIQDGVSGYTVSTPRAQLLACAIKKIYKDRTQAQQLACAGYETAKNCFNRDVMLSGYKKMFHSAMKQ